MAVWKTLKNKFFTFKRKKWIFSDFFRFFQKVFLKKKTFWSWSTSKFFYQNLGILHISSEPKIWIHPKSLSCFFFQFWPQGVHFTPFLRPRALGNRQIRPEDGRDWPKIFGIKFGHYCRILHKKNWNHTSKIEWDMLKYLCRFFLSPHGRKYFFWIW